MPHAMQRARYLPTLLRRAAVAATLCQRLSIRAPAGSIGGIDAARKHDNCAQRQA